MTVGSVNIDIHQGEKVAFVGHRLGKSTLMDLILTLYQPTYGSININGYDLFDSTVNHRQRWRVLYHVPQSSYLIDSSILNNITLSQTSPLISSVLNKPVKYHVDSIIDSTWRL